MSIPAYVGTHHVDGESKMYYHTFRCFTNGGTNKEMFDEVKEDWLTRIWGDHECHIEELPPGAARRGAIMIMTESIVFKAIGLFQAEFPNHIFEVEASCYYVVWEDLLTDGGDTPPHAKDGSEPPW